MDSLNIPTKPCKTFAGLTVIGKCDSRGVFYSGCCRDRNSVCSGAGRRDPFLQRDGSYAIDRPVRSASDVTAGGMFPGSFCQKILLPIDMVFHSLHSALFGKDITAWVSFVAKRNHVFQKQRMVFNKCVPILEHRNSTVWAVRCLRNQEAGRNIGGRKPKNQSCNSSYHGCKDNELSSNTHFFRFEKILRKDFLFLKGINI